MKKDEKTEFISDTTNLANENKKINTVFAKSFANSIVSIFILFEISSNIVCLAK
jgi:hypothetical protein